jgi:hypothetical protein
MLQVKVRLLNRHWVTLYVLSRENFTNGPCLEEKILNVERLLGQDQYLISGTTPRN